MVVAIDGPAGSGKSTIARMVADKLGATYVNSGNLYRALTLGFLEGGGDPADEAAVLAYAKVARVGYKGGRVCLDGRDVEDRLHTDAVDAWVARHSAIVPLRHVVNDIIRAVAEGLDVVVEGRDMTTVVFPHAEHKFFLDASIEMRAQRRHDQGVSKLSLDEIKRTIAERDEIDKNKAEGSLIRAKDAAYLDTSHLTINLVYDRVIRKIYAQGNTMGQMETEMDGAKAKSSQPSIQQQLQEEYLKSMGSLEEGQLIDGVVVEITQEHVFIDVGYKSEGKIPIEEFESAPKLGDTVSVVLVRKEGREGQIVVSKKKADEKTFWKNLRQAFQDKQPVSGTITRVVKGGYDVELASDIRAFLPISQADLQKVDVPEKLLGVKSKFYIDRLYSDNKVNIVVTRRNWLEEEVETNRQKFFETVQIGDEVVGTVKSFTSFGAFIDLGGFDGLLHINDMSWGHVTRPKDFVKKGDEIKLKVIRLDPAEKRINLSLKHFTDDPWMTFEDKYHINDVVKGKVTKLTDFGAFIELEEGIEGLAHISEFSWVKKFKKPEELLNPGDAVEVMILGYDLQSGRISLGLKQVTANPWESAHQRFPVGMRLTRKVVKLTNAGAFIELEDGIDGFLHVDDLSWTKKLKHPGSELQVGQELEVMVIEDEPGSHNIRLGVKQLSEDPWESFTKAFRVGSIIEGEVTSITDFGIFLRVQSGIEGLIGKQNILENRDDDYAEAVKKYKAGDKLSVVITEIHPESKKIAFSIRDYHKKVQREEISRYMQEGEEEGGYTLGDFLKNKGSNG